MTILASLCRQGRRQAPRILALYLPVFVVLGTAILMNRLAGIPIATLTRDPTSLAELPPWAGFVSDIGVLFWCAAMTLCFGGAVVLRRRKADRELALMLTASGCLTTMLMLDDFFVLHESFRDYLGVPEMAFFGFYFVSAIVFAARFWRLILKTDFLLLALALAFLGSSLVLDVFQHSVIELMPQSAYFLLEDGPKFFGIVSWFGYFSNLFVQALSPPVTSAE